MIDEFMEAARAGDVNSLRRSPELVNTRQEGATALHHAALHGRVEAVHWLLDQGAEIDALDEEFHMTPVAWAHEKGREAMVDLLLRRGAALSMLQAAGFGRLDRVKELAERDPSLLLGERNWGMPLHAACIWGRPAVVQWLVAQGADVGHRSRDGFTPLEIAERQARDGRAHTPIVTEERKAEIECNCKKIAEYLRTLAK